MKNILCLVAVVTAFFTGILFAEDQNGHLTNDPDSLVIGNVVSKYFHPPWGFQLELDKVEALEGTAPKSISVFVGATAGDPGGGQVFKVESGMRVLAIIKPSGTSFRLQSTQGLELPVNTLVILDENSESEIADIRLAIGVSIDPDQLLQNTPLVLLISNPQSFDWAKKIAIHQLIKRARKKIESGYAGMMSFKE